MRIITVLFFITAFYLPLAASEGELLQYGRSAYLRGEYYHGITEMMRYRYLYPEGSGYGESLVLSGKMYFRGGNSREALSAFDEAYSGFSGERAGQEGLYYGALVRLSGGSLYFGSRRLQEYRYIYPKGYFSDQALFYLCTARALSENYKEAESCYDRYARLYPSGKFRNEAAAQKSLVEKERRREMKSPWVAGVSSALLPGSGYFYSGKYMVGVFSMLTTGSMILLAYDGYRKENDFQLIFFSLFGLSFYNHSVIGSVRSVREYNSREVLNRELLLGIKKAF